MYSVDILADSLNEPYVGFSSRLTTFEVTFPRFILAEVNTHRALSRNSASSRAIPTERFISALMENPFVPEFNERVKGMGVGASFSPELQEEAEGIWLQARSHAVDAAIELMELGVDKSRANRLLEPFMWHTAIISGTEWGNFFALRTDEGAQPEFRLIAKLMLEAYEAHSPDNLGTGDLHIPLVTRHELKTLDRDVLRKVAVGRLARRSSYNRHDPEPLGKSIERHDILSHNGHWSPFEHIATAQYEMEWSGNFFGFDQYRKEFPYEADYSLERNAHA